MKYSDFIFYANRSSRSWFTRAIWTPQNGAKVSQNPGFCAELQWVRSRILDPTCGETHISKVKPTFQK